MVLVELGRNMELEAGKIEQRLDRTASALNNGNVDYAVIGGNAVGAWLKTKGAGIQTRDVDILLRRNDTALAAKALSVEGFVRRDMGSHTMFMDGPKARDAVRVVFAGEKYDKDSLEPAPPVEEYEIIDGARVIALSALVRMKLTAGRSKDLGHLIELLKAGVIDPSKVENLPESLKGRWEKVLLEREATRRAWRED